MSFRPSKGWLSEGGFMNWVAVGVAISIVVVIAILSRSASKRESQGSAALSGVTSPTEPLIDRSSMSAVDLLERVQDLRRSNAQWAEIWRALNPDGNPTTQELLQELRNDHQFVPHVRLNQLVAASEDAIKINPNMDRNDVVRAVLGIRPWPGR
jgi:hypothetical protein